MQRAATRRGRRRRLLYSLSMLAAGAVAAYALSSGPAAGQTPGSGTMVVATHRAEVAEPVGPNETVAFTVTVENQSGEPLQDIVVRVAADASVFAAVVAAEGQQESMPLEGGLDWKIDVLQAGLAATRRYEAKTAGVFTTPEATNNALVLSSTGATLAEATAVVSLVDPFQSISVVHTTRDVNPVVGAGETIEFEVTVSPQADVDDPVALLIELDESVFDPSSAKPVSLPGGWGGQPLAWEAARLAAGEDQVIRYSVQAVDELPQTVTTVVTAAVIEIGQASKRVEVESSLGSPRGTIDITHGRSDPATTVSPGATVPFTVTVRNDSDRGIIEDLVVQVTQPDPAVVTLVALEPPIPGDGLPQLEWQIGHVGAGEQQTLHYEVVVPEDAVGLSLGDLLATATFAGGTSEAKAPIKLVGAGILDVEHVPEVAGPLEPGGTVTYTIRVTNATGFDVAGIEVKIEPDTDVFRDPTPAKDAENGCSTERKAEGEQDAQPTWCFELAAGAPTEELSYEITAADELPDRSTPAVNTAVVEVKSGGVLVGQPNEVGSTPRDLPRPRALEPEAPALGADLSFTLTVLFLLLSFASVTYLVMSKRADSPRVETGRSMFIIVSLLSATLILAFGTTRQTEALGLLAAIAGYVLGRGVTERQEQRGDGGQDPGDRTIQPTAGGSGGGGAAAVATNPMRDSTVTASMAELRRLGRDRRITSLSLLSISLLSPVLIVLAAVWLLDSTGNFSVAWTIYASAGSIALLLLMFLGGLAYVFDDDGPAGGEHTVERSEVDASAGDDDQPAAGGAGTGDA